MSDSISLKLAVIGRNHFGNPIPQEWYAAARELLASATPQEAAPVRDFPAQFYASGPEGEFFTNSHAFAETMITASGRDRDEWTITDLTHPTPTDESGQGREATVAEDAARLAAEWRSRAKGILRELTGDEDGDAGTYALVGCLNGCANELDAAMKGDKA